jgi:hypothetical protein
MFPLVAIVGLARLRRRLAVGEGIGRRVRGEIL